MNRKKNQMYDEDDSIDIIESLSKILKSKIFILKITILFTLIGIIYSLSLKNIYRSSSIFYPHYEKIENTNNLRDLAGLAGINLGSQSNENIPSNLYPNLISSPIFKRKVLDETINVGGDQLSYRDYLLNNSTSFDIKKILLFPITLLSNLIPKDEVIINNNSADILSFSNDEYRIHKYLKNIIHLNLNEKEGFIELSVDDKNPHVASQVAEISKNILQESIIEFKIKNVNDTYEFISDQLEIAKNNFYIIQDSLARFKDKNKNIKTDLFLNQYSRIETEYNISRNLYNELAINKEKISIDVRKNTPIFTVIKPVVLPNDKFAPKRTIIVLIFSILGILIGSIWVLFKNSLFDIISNIRSK